MTMSTHALLFLALAAAAPEYCVSFAYPSSVSLKTASITTTRLFAAKEDALKEGLLVEFASGTGANKQVGLGAILGKEGKRNLKILTSLGRTTSVPPRAITHVVPNGRSISDAAQIARHESAAAAALVEDAAEGGESVAEVWEMLLEEGTGMDLATLAELMRGDATSVSCHATRAVLTAGAASFCFKEVAPKVFDDAGPTYEPRQAEVVEALRSKARNEAAEAAEWETLKQRLADDAFNVAKETEETRAAFQALELLGSLANLNPDDALREEKAAHGRGAAAHAAAREFLRRLGRRATPEAARQLLGAVGVWDKHTNLDLVRLQVPIEFGPLLEDAAADVAAHPPPDADAAARLDLTHLPAFAIDEASTQEIDDALSVEILTADGGSRRRLWVHIADPTRYIELGSPLGREARRRGSSIYLPTETIPMFPMSLAAGPLSLRVGEAGCALSVGIELNEAGGLDEATPPIITPSLVNTTRLTYEQVDELLDPFALVNDEHDNGNDGEKHDIENLETVVECLRQLQYASEQRLRWRVDGGSLESIDPYELPDMSVKVRRSPEALDGWHVDIKATERVAANRIVSELMLAANEAMALYGATHDVPLPFRAQEMEAPSDAEIAATPAGPCRSWLAIRSTRGAQVAATPLPHRGLGLDMYVQSTSPIRRYADLALHYQIKSHLRGDALPFPGHEGDAGSNAGETMVSIAKNGGALSRQLERPANDYWLKEFLQRRGTQLTRALVLSSEWKENVYKILLPDLGAICDYSSTTPLANGEQIDLQSAHLASLIIPR